MTTVSMSSILAAWPNTYNIVFNGLEYQLNVQNSWTELTGAVVFSATGEGAVMEIILSSQQPTPLAFAWRVTPIGSGAIQLITASPLLNESRQYLGVSGVPTFSGQTAEVVYIDAPEEELPAAEISFLLASSAAICAPQPTYPSSGQRWPWGIGPRNDVVSQPGCPALPSYPSVGQRWPYGYT